MRLGIVVAGLALTLGCAKKDAAPDSTAAAPSAAPATPAAPTSAVRIVSPAEGDTVGPSVTIRLSGEGVTIEKASGIRVEGVGHYHLFLDAPASAENAVIPPNSNTIVHIGTGDSTYTYAALTPGPHEIIAAVGYGDHALMNTRRDTVRFVVKR
jgi:hypothetical protein